MAQIKVLGQVCAVRCAALDIEHRNHALYLAVLDQASAAVLARSPIGLGLHSIVLPGAPGGGQAS